MAHGFLIAAPQSGSGKTVVTLGLLRALRDRGISLGSAKAGPDFIDPAFHAHAASSPCVNLDPWAMRHETLTGLMARQSLDRLTVVEAMMGLFDGAADGSGSAADLAEMFDMPVVLVVDCARQSHSVAALVEGFVNHRPSLRFGGLVLNRVGSDRHEHLLRSALESIGVPVLGVVRRSSELELPSRHLGLVQAREHGALETFVSNAGRIMTESIDLDRLVASECAEVNSGSIDPIPPLGQRMAIARDDAFAFAYPHLLNGWRNAGAELSFFSPLADEAPPPDCDSVFLSGGYPELHGDDLSNASIFREGLEEARDRGAVIYGECGGFMVLGEALVDSHGASHAMAGLLPVVTSFATRKLNLGYRRLTTVSETPLGRVGTRFSAHEFHYSSLVSQGARSDCTALFKAEDAMGMELGEFGLCCGSVAGSYMHLIDVI